MAMKPVDPLTDPQGARARGRARARLRALPVASEASLPRASEAALRSPLDEAIRHSKEKLAFEIHDGLTQNLAASILELESLQLRLDGDPAAARDPAVAKKAIADAAAELRRALSDVRKMLFELGGERAEPPHELREAVEFAEKKWGISASFRAEGDVAAAPGPVIEVAEVVLREGLANVAKHSSSLEADIEVKSSPDLLALSIEDRGPGFSPEQRDGRARHFGVVMMKRRVAEVGGTLRIRPTIGGGTRVEALIPLSPRD